MVRASCVGAVLLVLFAIDSAPAREWHARNGSASIEAELLDFRDGNVILKRKDGKVIEVPLDKLSLPDVKYVKDTLKELGIAPETPTNSPPQNVPATKTADNPASSASSSA